MINFLNSLTNTQFFGYGFILITLFFSAVMALIERYEK